MQRTDKYGFTILELVIVIAVVATLAAVLIPTFSSVVEEAQKSKDLALLRNIQTILESERLLGTDVSNEEKALAVLKENGIEDIGDSIQWNDESMSFVLRTPNGIINDSDVPEVVEIDPVDDAEEKNEADKPATVSLSVALSTDALQYSDSESDKVVLNEPYTASLIVPYSHYLMNYSVKMGDVDITDSCTSIVDGNVEISIDKVTDKLEITAKAVENRVRTSKDLYGTHIYGDLSNGYNAKQTADGKGYVDNACLSTQTNLKGICAADAKGYTATGWMQLPWDKWGEIVIYIYSKDGNLIPQTNDSSRYYLYWDLTTSKQSDNINTYAELINSNYMKITFREDPHGCFKYFRLSVPGKGEDLIVTFNEPIFPYYPY